MREYALPVAGVLLNLAMNLSIAKDWTKRLPDWFVVLLWVLSLVPLGYWLWTHPRIFSFLRTRYAISMILIVLLGALCGGGLAGMGYAFWYHAKTKAPNPSATQDDKPTPTAKPQEQASAKNKDGDKKDIATTDAKKKNDTHKPVPKAPEKPNASPSQQPTYSVTNPSGSIINQGSKVDAPQTVNNFRPAPRQVTNPDALIASLREIAKSSNEPAIVLIVMTEPDQESKPFRDALAEVFHKAEWKVTSNNSRNNFSFNGEAFTQGLLCSGETETTLNAVADALEASGIRCSERKKVNAPSNQAFPVWLAIGKPE